MEDEISRSIRIGLQQHYFTELGRFVAIFALTEAMLKKVLQATAKVDDSVSLAIFSGTRSDAVSSFIRRCFEARGERLPEKLAILLERFALFSNLRNDVLHHGIDFSTTPPTSSNKLGVLNPRAVRETPIERDDLYDASHDLGVIMLGLTAFLGRDDPRMLDVTSRHPWRYKPTPPKNKGRSRHPKKRARRAQPRRP